MALSRFQESLADWDQVVATVEEAGRDFRRSERAVVLARAGDHGRAAAEAATLAEKGSVKDEGLYNAGCAYSLCIPAVRKDAKLTAAEREDKAHRYADRAMELLTRVRAAPFMTADFLKDADLDPVRSRPDFQQLVADLKK
jgi:hypothetical protein